MRAGHSHEPLLLEEQPVPFAFAEDDLRALGAGELVETEEARRRAVLVAALGVVDDLRVLLGVVEADVDD